MPKKDVLVRKKCAECDTEEITWPNVSACRVCGGPLKIIDGKDEKDS